jgi:hypothetical protein
MADVPSGPVWTPPPTMQIKKNTFVVPWPLLQFRNRFTVELLGRVISPPHGLYLYTEQHKQNKRTQYRHPFLVWNSNPRTQRSNERRNSCLRPRGHCDRLNVWFLFPLALQLNSGLGRLHEISVSLRLLDPERSVGLLGRVISSSQDPYLYTNTEKRTHNTNTKHPFPEWDSNTRRQFIP